jgi:hypothetical protein
MVRRSAATLIVAALALSVAGCGAPDYEYVKSSENQTYFKVPRDWQRVDQKRLDKWLLGDPDSASTQERQDRVWTVAYDSSPVANVMHIYSNIPTQNPVVWAKVEDLAPTEGDAVSLDSLRNLALPVSADARLQAAQEHPELNGFELLADEVITPQPGLHGVHVVFNYRLGGAVHTFDQTALITDDATRTYLFLLRCTASCFKSRKSEIADVVQSFTVRRT